MDLLRIRETPSPAREPAGSPGPATDCASLRLEDLLREELDAVALASEGVAETEDNAPSAGITVALGPTDPHDLLDEFFWREDETAPRFPDLVAASALPAAPEPVEVRHEWLTFRLAEEVYALEIHHVREILKPPPLTEVPRAPGHVLGIIMNRGEVIAVLDPRARLALPRRSADARARILVCDSGDGPRGLLVDAVSHVVRIAQSAIEPRPASMGGAAAEFIAGIGHERGRLYVLLDAVALLADAAPVVEAQP